MRLVLALAQLPLEEGGAVGRVAVATMRGLAQHGVDVHAVAAVQPFTITGTIPDDLDVETVHVEAPIGGWRGRIATLRAPRSELAGRFAARVQDVVRHADVLHLEEPETAWSRSIDVPTVLRLHYLVRRDRPLTYPWRRSFRERVEFAAAEARAVRSSRWLVANSREVADELRRRAPRADVTVAPLALDPARYPRAPLDGPQRVGLIGTASWPPTAAAMRRLVDRVWPLVRREVPDAELVVAGRGVDQLHLPGSGVTVTGAVDSAADFLAGLSALVFPLGRGSGAKVKVLEALACGVPVVTTTSGGEGAAPSDGLVIADDDDEIAAAAIRLLRDATERRERGTAAADAFRRAHAPVPATEPLVALYRRMAEAVS